MTQKLIGVCQVPSCSKRSPLLLNPFCSEHFTLLSQQTRDAIAAARTHASTSGDRDKYDKAVSKAVDEIEAGAK